MNTPSDFPDPSEYSQAPPQIAGRAIVRVAQLGGWNLNHCRLLLKLIKHLLSLEGENFAWRREMAQQTQAYPIYGDIGGAVVLELDGSLALVDWENEETDSMSAWARDSRADMERWVRFAWSEGVQSLPAAFQQLEPVAQAARVATVMLPAPSPGNASQ